jgi:hypothetical protein
MTIERVIQSVNINNQESQFTFYDIVLIWIGIVSALIIITLCMGKFSPPTILIGSVIITIMLLLSGKIRPIWEVRFTLGFLLLLFIALLFRYSNATYYMGGQDEGLYVNMSATLTNTGKIEFFDRLRASLPDDLKAEYDAYTEPGVGSVDNPETSMYSVKFYPMHPAWMALATFLFGQGKHILSLLFFSLVGLAGMYLLTMELTGDDKRAGYIALLFGAINPGLVYFTTFPVGEMVALCFSINGFYLLSRGFHCQDQRLRWFFLAGSALLFSAFCYTRMTLFLFFPILLVIVSIVFFWEKYSHLRLSLSVYLVSLIALFALSWAFYYKYQPSLAQAMYQANFKALVAKYGALALIGIVLYAALLISIRRTKFGNRLCITVEKSVTWLENHAALLLFIALALSLFSILRLYREGINSAAIDSKSYPLMFQFSTLHVLMLFISPTLLLMLLVLPFMRIKFQRVQILPILFLTTTWLVILYDVRYLFPLYYYGRYLCSEMVPYSLILCGIILSILFNEAKWKRIAIVITSMTVVYFAVYSVVQIGHPQTEDPRFLYQLDRVVGNNDVIIFDNRIRLDGRILTTPLKLYFDKQVYRGTSIFAEDGPHTINYFYDHSGANSGSKYGVIYLLEETPLDLSENGFGNALTLIGKYDYSFGNLVNFPQYKIGSLYDPKTWYQILLPYQYGVFHSSLYLYRVERRLAAWERSSENSNNDSSQNGNLDYRELAGISNWENLHPASVRISGDSRLFWGLHYKECNLIVR